MNLNVRYLLTAGLILGTGVFVTWSQTSSTQAAAAEKTQTGVPVEPDMHEFMEYVFQPTYRRLKKSLATEPDNNQIWKAIKSDSLILAEGGNLLLLHKPENDRTDWDQHSIQVRQFGGQLYKAAKVKDYQASKAKFALMLKNCNACHKQFDNGKHQLKP
ncbi:hypothetical protein Pan241w_38110 [Gimesia alba]|uniref:Cytochrome C n=1 Tax=Gimesia alba TaxID=2527973 RepID=A0A517RIL8_9PLAN|nr:cytochrome c [Gimesia alba]QDT43709.1 hypothetical protein Pan241w_38110 [Gimesia alba]